MPITLSLTELEQANATLDKLQELAGDETARAILMQCQLLMLTLAVRIVCAAEAQQPLRAAEAQFEGDAAMEDEGGADLAREHGVTGRVN